MQPALAVFLAVVAITCINATTVHDNHVFFTGPDSFSFSMTGHSITSGQPFDGVSISGNDMVVKAGRHGSSGPAEDFKAGLQFLNTIGLDTALDQMPGTLNFAIWGDATFKFGSKSVTCKDFKIGQGHEGFSNNWWSGASYCISVPTTHQMTCACGGILGPMVYISAGDDDHHFNVRLATASGFLSNSTQPAQPASGP
jgi:hypothetical protein